MDNNREKIIMAARKAFAEKGIHRATLGDIAREAGIAKGTLYYYYKSKESLVFEVLDHGIGVLLNGFGGINEETDLAGLTRGLLEAMTANTELLHIYFHLLQESFRNPALRERFRHKYREWREWGTVVFRQCKLGDPEELSTLFIAILDGLCLQWLVEPEAVNPKKISLALAKLFDHQVKK
ncbi:TetR/AcrR family transcriptional regulator [Thermincola potens]|uniref:Transcriptional regulator, TetR family n=1 Tax=Thermincola potens (strain JR) TaxID=635013 RepID=D5X9L1_THEPJ|nr:TetR/AcrR family transcriptional regulator [Thermincola potens]ADG81082.1 transcriptional regulator, TetR family [Thermincola potens JR]